LAKLEEFAELSDIVASIFEPLDKLLSQNLNLHNFCCDSLLPDNHSDAAHARNVAPAFDAGQLTARIVKECGTILEKQSLRHGLQFIVHGNHDSEVYGECDFEKSVELPVKIEPKLFVIAVMNLIQNAFLYARPNSTVVVTIDCESDEDGYDFVCVSIANPSGKDHELLRGYTEPDGDSGEPANEEAAKLGIPLASKIAACYGGKMDYISIGDKVVAKFMLPLAGAPDECVYGFSSTIDEYVADDKGVVRLFMNEVVRAAQK
jgi:hypothetical protein